MLKEDLEKENEQLKEENKYFRDLDRQLRKDLTEVMTEPDYKFNAGRNVDEPLNWSKIFALIGRLVQKKKDVDFQDWVSDIEHRVFQVEQKQKSESEVIQ